MFIISQDRWYVNRISCAKTKAKKKPPPAGNVPQETVFRAVFYLIVQQAHNLFERLSPYLS